MPCSKILHRAKKKKKIYVKFTGLQQRQQKNEKRSSFKASSFKMLKHYFIGIP